MAVITAAQCRAARALLGWSQDQLAQASKVGKATIATFETGKRAPYERTLLDLRSTLEAAGVSLMFDGQAVEGGEGARFRKEDGISA